MDYAPVPLIDVSGGPTGRSSTSYSLMPDRTAQKQAAE